MKKQTLFIGVGIALLLLIAAGIFFALRLNRTPVIAFYRLSDKEISSLTAVLPDDYTYLTYTNDTSLYAQTRTGKKPDLIITTSGNPLQTAQSLANKHAVLPASLLEGMTTSVRTSVQRESEDEIHALPLLSGHFEIDINMNMLRKTGIKTITSWDDIERFARAAQTDFPAAHIIFAGRSGEIMLDMLGALTESFVGNANYTAAIQQIEIALDKHAKGTEALNPDTLARALAGNESAPLYDAVQFLRRLVRAGLIAQDTFSMDKASVSAYMQSNLASVVLMSLSDHRATANDIIAPFTSIYVPSDTPAVSRVFTAPILYAVPFSKNKKALQLVQTLVTPDRQEDLSHATGLAPVLARCRTPDRQADDARYWIAATNSPVAGLSRETALSDQQLNDLAVALGMLIR